VAEAMSRRGGSRDRDGDARRLIEQNRGTIERLADQLSNGAYSASRAPKAEPQAEGLIIHVLGGTPATAAPEPYVRISANDRVVLADHESGRQLHYLGQIRRVDGQRRFVLATKANGFYAAVDAKIGAALAGLDGMAVGGADDEERLAADIRHHLGLS
jgi:hypothetical protein